MKKLYIEFLRIVCIWIVVFIHTGSKGFFLYSISDSSILYPFYLFSSVACTVAVPIFFMISGALLIPKQESIGNLYHKRILRMMFVLFVFSFAQYTLGIFANKAKRFSILEFLRNLYTNNYAWTYWYIYAYIGILIMLPLIRKMAVNMKNRDFYYLFGISVFFRGIIPIVQYIIGKGDININAYLITPLLSQNIVFFIAGHYLANVIPDENLSIWKAFIGGICGCVAIMISCYMTVYKINITGLNTEADAQTFYGSFALVSSMAVFYSVRCFFTKIGHKINLRTQKIITTLGGCSFGVMLIEGRLRDHLSIVFDIFQPYVRTFLACWIWVLSVWICGVIITLIMKKVPMFKNIL